MRAPHAAARCRISPCRQGGKGQQDPTPRKEDQAQRQDTEAPWPIQALGRPAAKLTVGWEAGLRALPPSPPSNLEARKPGLGGRPFQGPDKCSDRRGKGSRPSQRDPLVWRQEGVQKTRQLLPRRDPGGGWEPRWGLPAERMKNSCLCRASSGGDSMISRALSLSPSQKRAAWSPHPQPTGPGPGACGSDRPGQLGADNASVPGELACCGSSATAPALREGAPLPATSHTTCQAGGAHSHTWWAGGRGWAQGKGHRPRPDRNDRAPHPHTGLIRGPFPSSDTSELRAGRASPP